MENFLTVSQDTETNSEAHKNFVLFFGPPGTGKTNLVNNIIVEYAKYVIQNNDIYFFKLTLNDIRAPHHLGVLKNQVLKIAEKEKNKIIIFFDELDGLIKNRDHAESSDKDKSMITEFLQFLDDCKTKSNEYQNVFFIACTNYINNVDKAGVRRLSQFQIGLPSYSLRKNIVLELFKDSFINIVRDSFINIVTVLTAGFSCDGIKKRINSLFFCDEGQYGINYWEKLLSFFSMNQYKDLTVNQLIIFAKNINDKVMQDIDNKVSSIQNISLLGQENYRLLVDLSDELGIEKEKEDTILSLMKEYINQSKTLFESFEEKIESVVDKLISSQERISEEYVRFFSDIKHEFLNKNKSLRDLAKTLKREHKTAENIWKSISEREDAFKDMNERFNELSNDLIEENKSVMKAVDSFVEKIDDRDTLLQHILDSFNQLPQVLKDAVHGIMNTQHFLLTEYKANKESAIKQQESSVNIMQGTLKQFQEETQALNSSFQLCLKKFLEDKNVQEKEHEINIKSICKGYSDNIEVVCAEMGREGNSLKAELHKLSNEVKDLQGKKRNRFLMFSDYSQYLKGLPGREERRSCSN